MWQRLLWLSVAGAAGALARYVLSGLLHQFRDGEFPWGTLVVNTLGCFLFGLIWGLAEKRMLFSGETRTIILVGFMGAFTTFSTFVFETSSLLRVSAWLPALGNMLLQLALGLVLLRVGMALGQAV